MNFLHYAGISLIFKTTLLYTSRNSKHVFNYVSLKSKTFICYLILMNIKFFFESSLLILTLSYSYLLSISRTLNITNSENCRSRSRTLQCTGQQPTQGLKTVSAYYNITATAQDFLRNFVIGHLETRESKEAVKGISKDFGRAR